MDSFNKVISFVLGLVVVIVFFLVVTGKINLKGKLGSTPATNSKTTGFFNFGGSSVTPTLTPTPTQSTSSASNGTVNSNNTYNQTGKTVKTSKTIPSTGLPTLFIPILFSGLAGGSFLSKSGKKKH
jgi:hypothetical protein